MPYWLTSFLITVVAAFIFYCIGFYRGGMMATILWRHAITLLIDGKKVFINMKEDFPHVKVMEEVNEVPAQSKPGV